MIHLDANVLILLPRLTADNHPLIQRLRGDEEVAVSSIAWFEYLCGPVIERDLPLTRIGVDGRILDVDQGIAERAALLFNGCGRKRALRTDCLIAATALLAEAELATFNAADFAPFVPYGLKLLPL